MADIVGVLFKQDTIIKQSPANSSTLPSNQKQTIPVGTFLVLQSYASPSDSTNNHFRLNLKTLQIKGYSQNWYAFAPHVEVGQQSTKTVQSVSDVVSKQTDKNVAKISVDKTTIPAQCSFLKLVFNVDTVIKRRPIDSQIIDEKYKQSVPAGTELVLVTNRPDANNIVSFPIENSHVKVSFKDIEFKGFTQDWYVFMGHVGIQRLG